jgi:hypothetical protein
VKLGTENKTKVAVAAVLMVLAVGYILYELLGSGSISSPPTATSTAATTAAPAAARTAKGKKAAAPRSLDPTLRYDLLKASEDTKYEGNGRNVFRAEAEIPQPVANPNIDEAMEKAQQPQGPPPPPPITLKFFGFANRPGEPKRIFLSQGDDVFIAREGDVIDRRYRIVHINPTSVEVEDVLNNNHQNIPLVQG